VAAGADGHTRDRAAGTPPDDVRIRARGLTKRYGDLVAVDHLDLDVKTGEIFGLLGQNGAGKTTTILMLLGLTEPSSGRENLRYTARLNRIQQATADATIDEVLEQVGLTGRADDRTDTYSRGMLQRLGIADALVKDPDVLILDEPTTAIDPLGVGEILDLLRRLVHERGLTILLSSHLLNQVQSVCDRIGIFASGRLIGQGTMADLAARFGDGSGHLEVGLDLTSADDISRVHGLIAAIDGVSAVAPGSGAARLWSVTLTSAADAPRIRTAIFGIVAEHGLPLTSIREVVPSLEDLYRRAVSRPAPARPDAAA